MPIPAGGEPWRSPHMGLYLVMDPKFTLSQVDGQV